MKRKVLPYIIVLAGVTIPATCARAQLSSWDLSTSSSWGASPMPPTTSDAGVTVTGLTRGSGVTMQGTAATNAWGGAGFRDDITSAANQTAQTAIDRGNYVTFALKANEGNSLSLSGIGPYNIRRSNGLGPANMLWQYSLDGTSFSNIGTTVPTGGNTAASGNEKPAIALDTIAALQSVPSATTVTFRIVLWGATADLGPWYLNGHADATSRNLIINGTVGGAPLPLQLLSFTGQQEGAYNLLRWTTTAERNTGRFEIERSVDNRHYTVSGSIQAAAQEGTHRYQYREEATGRDTWYRLKMLDRDGSYAYSEVVLLRTQAATGTLNLYPNPAIDRLFTGGLTGTVDYQVTDLAGRLLLAGQALPGEEDGIDISDLNQGIYILAWKQGDRAGTLRFVKK